jgi:hypothetical protein
MEIRTVSNTLGWDNNRLIKEFKTTYDYEKGNDVTVVERRSYAVQVYSSSGVLDDYPSKGNQIDTKV